MQSFFRTTYLFLGVLGFFEWASLPASAADFDMKAVTSTPGPGLHIVITWSEAPGITKFNLYRKTNPLDAYPKVPLNGSTPLTIYDDCTKITSLIPVGSEEWETMRNGLADNNITPFDPCKIASIPRGATKFARLEIMARAKWKIAVIIGQGYDDKAVVNGTSYYYELRAVDDKGNETGVLATNVAVVAGSPTPAATPTGLKATAGDAKVLLVWDEVADSAGFNVYRSLSMVGPYQRINNSSFISRIEVDLDGNPITPTNGFVDFQRWDPSGNPASHLVNGVAINGPANGTNYYYEVSSVDLLNQEGAKTAPVSAKPVDKTPPMTPSEILVTANNTAGQLEITWAKVTYDSAGHVEPAFSGYKVYRYDLPESTSPIQIGGLYPQPAGGILYASAIDADAVLRPPYGEKPFYYRIECIDSNGNVSARSAAASGKLNDITPPDPPQNLKAEGFEDFILLTWDLNNEPDMDGYLIYRSLCDFGKWVCDPTNKNQNVDVTSGKRCPEFFTLVGYLSQADAKEIAGAGVSTYFEDHTVPQGSPLCYAYLIKAQDKSQNQSGKWPIPDLTKEKVVCQRLRDKTPPDPAIVSGLFARDNGILVEWIGAPVQDIAAYHVYRGELETGPYKFVGGMTVVKPPAAPVVLTLPYVPPAVVGCDTIPLEKKDYMSAGSFLDTSVIAKQIYWYKVLGVDQVGNETQPSKGVSVSTFTFSRNKPDTPVISSVDITSTTGTCALVVHWTPAYDPAVQRNFIVFRSESIGGLYRQVATVAGSEFVDINVVRGIEYWYKVCQLNVNNILSPLSAAKNGTVTP